MLYYTLLAFFALVLYQTIAKKAGWRLPSNGLKYVRDRAVAFWDWLGLFVGRCLNVWEWFKYLEKWLRKIWDFIIDHIWENIKPFFESIIEIGKPAWQILFSWGYFFVGFARTHYIFFSWMGGSAAIAVTAYFFRDYWMWMLQNWVFYLVVTVAVGLFGIMTAFPGILSDMFPRTISFFEIPPEPTVTIQDCVYSRSELLKLRNEDLKRLLDLSGKHCSNRNYNQTSIRKGENRWGMINALLR